MPLTVNAGLETPLVLFGFNPQPEPPPGFGSAIGFQFAFNDLGGVDTVWLSQQVLDESGLTFR